LALSFYCPTFEKDKGVANVVCSDAYSYIDTQGEFLYGFSPAMQAFITSPYSLSVKCQDIDDPSLTVKSVRTSMTLLKY